MEVCLGDVPFSNNVPCDEISYKREEASKEANARRDSPKGVGGKARASTAWPRGQANGPTRSHAATALRMTRDAGQKATKKRASLLTSRRGEILSPGAYRLRVRQIASFLLFWALAGACHAQSGAVVCRDGIGNFEAISPTGVSVQVRAARSEGFARRACEGALLWEKSKALIASGVTEMDVDAFGIDLGLGSPVATFQVKKSQAECCMTLQIYSLRKPPKLVRSITGGTFFSTADTDLDGQVEIWTNDTASLDGFERRAFGGPYSAPTVVLRFVQGRLLDVGSEFQGYFDGEIARVRSGLDPEELREFKNSSGRLAPTAYFSAEDLHRSQKLERTKERVLQIVWAYLYSGREQEAWKSLAELWPPADFDRIREAIISARDRGIRAQVDGVSEKVSSGAEKNPVVFDARTLRVVQASGMLAGEHFEGERIEGKRTDIVLPAAILIGHKPVEGRTDDTLPDSGLMLDLVIDSAGKVRSAASTNPLFDSPLKDATTSWKFVPAFRSERPIASEIYLIITPKR